MTGPDPCAESDMAAPSGSTPGGPTARIAKSGRSPPLPRGALFFGEQTDGHDWNGTFHRLRAHPGDGNAPRVLEDWRAEWQRRLPDRAGHDGAALDRIARRVEGHLAAMREASGPGNPHRQSLRERLVRLFRRHTGQMGAVFAHLGITGLDLERARAGIMARRLMPGRTEGRSWA